MATSKAYLLGLVQFNMHKGDIKTKSKIDLIHILLFKYAA